MIQNAGAASPMFRLLLSQGQVFRGRLKRLETEVTDVLRGAYGLQRAEHSPHWFLSNVFFEATLEWKVRYLSEVKYTTSAKSHIPILAI
jgi:hypothetical protein